MSQLGRQKAAEQNQTLGKVLDALFTDQKIGSMPGFVGTVGTTSVVVLNANPLRVYSIIVNDSLQDIWLGFGETAVAEKGIRLNSEGGSYEVTWKNLFCGTISAIALVANCHVVGVDGYNIVP